MALEFVSVWGGTEVTARERALLRRLEAEGFAFSRVVRGADSLEPNFSPGSAREFDLRVEGLYGPMGRLVQFRGWLPLLAVRELTPWTSAPVANLTDYPEMARSGDWSGVRDSSSERLWAIFDLHVLPVVEMLVRLM